MQKLYCYVDEAGQHTKGLVFVVSVVVIDSTPERDRIAPVLEAIEQASRKRLQKWHSSRHEERFAYMTAVLTNSAFKGLLFYQMYHSSREYVDMTMQTTASAISSVALPDYKATILVDGLSKPESQSFATALRREGIRTRKVRGIDDTQNVFIRLADALCWLVLDAYEGNEIYARLLKQGRQTGFISIVGE